MRFAALLTAVATLSLALFACGGERAQGGATQYVPAAGANTPPDVTPGVPPGSAYDVSGGAWLKLPREQRLLAARDYVADNPGACARADGRSAAAASVRAWADVSLGTDYPLNAPVVELLAEGCAAALQRGGGEPASAG